MSSLPQPDLAGTFGALFIGVTGAALIFGITNVQVFIYFQAKRGTGITLYNLAVIGLWILDALHLALITYSVYYYLVINYGNVIALTEMVWSLKLQGLLDFLIIYGIHILYAHRIWIFSEGRPRTLAKIVGVILIITSAVGLTLVWAIYRCRTFEDWFAMEWSAYMSLATIACNDIIIALSLCYLLATSRTGFSSTDTLLTKLMAYIINTGVLTSATSVITIITCAAMPGSFTYIAVQFILIKLYVTSFLALMNARHYMRPGHSDTNDTAQICVRYPSLQAEGLDTENEGSRKNMFRRSSDHDDNLYPTRPVQPDVPQEPIVLHMEMNSFSSP